MGVKKDTTKGKHREMFKCYENLVSQEGTRASSLAKSYFYERVGDMFFVSADHAAKVIRGKLKGAN